MTAKAGRAVALFLTTPPATEAARVAGVKTKSVSLSAEGIETTNDDDAGYRSFLDATASVKTLDIEVQGVAKDNVLSSWHAAGDHRVATLEYPDGRVITGTFRMSAYSEESATDGAVEFSGTLNSTGSFSDTPPTA
jgi:TP901-1 family phage major tail protein